MTKWIKIPEPGQFRGAGKWVSIQEIGMSTQQWEYYFLTGFLPAIESEERPQ